MRYASHAAAFLALAGASKADDSLEFVRRAQDLLRSSTWSEVIRIRNSGNAGRYPASLHALVFELDSVLWFYTPTDGTQSLSLYRGRARADRANLGSLLLAIDPGFTAWEAVPDGPRRASRGSRPPNGCFIEAVSILLRELERGRRIMDARLLSYYVTLPGGTRGHTVLEYRTDTGLEVIDPLRPDRVIRLPHASADDPGSVARRLRDDVASARTVPLAEFLRRREPAYASVAEAPSPRS